MHQYIPALIHLQWLQGAGYLRNISVELDTDNRGRPFRPTLLINKDNSGPGHELDGLEVYGRDRRDLISTSGPDSTQGSLPVTTFGESPIRFGEGDVQRNVYVHDLNNDVDTVLPLRALEGDVRLERIGPGRIDVVK